uniref:Loricrin n=1 Tax=Macrostomum lignano TaxID=282301 RepID=A0A1I8GWL7_9PLAT
VMHSWKQLRPAAFLELSGGPACNTQVLRGAADCETASVTPDYSAADCNTHVNSDYDSYNDHYDSDYNVFNSCSTSTNSANLGFKTTWNAGDLHAPCGQCLLSFRSAWRQRRFGSAAGGNGAIKIAHFILNSSQTLTIVVGKPGNDGDGGGGGGGTFVYTSGGSPVLLLAAGGGGGGGGVSSATGSPGISSTGGCSGNAGSNPSGNNCGAG